jgi:hypothetical protein
MEQNLFIFNQVDSAKLLFLELLFVKLSIITPKKS